VILRPSVVLGPGAFGASALFRGLASLPILPIMPETGKLQVVQLDDVVSTVIFFLLPQAPTRLVLELAGPEVLSFEDVVRSYRRWFGWKPAWPIFVPKPLAGLMYKLGDFAGALGWRPAIRSTARKEVLRGAAGDPGQWVKMTGIRPQALGEVLARRPASVQERWFAKLYLLKPIILAVISLFWISTGAISLTTGYEIGMGLMHRAEAGILAAPIVVLGALADLLVGAAIALRRTARWGLYAAIALSLTYAFIGTILLPELWNEPLGPLLKIWPIVVLHLAALAILEER
jgi:hypothetical protein